MAKPYREGNGWAFRLRTQGQDVYRSGFTSEAAAKRAASELTAHLAVNDQAYGQGPFQTTLAEAFIHYATHKLPFLKGAAQDKNRINRYLRATNSPVIQLERVSAETAEKHHYWKVSFHREPQRAIPTSLQSHRSRQARQTQKADQLRRNLAATKLGDVSPFQVQALINAMREEGAKAANIANERAELRRLTAIRRHGEAGEQAAKEVWALLLAGKLDHRKAGALLDSTVRQKDYKVSNTTRIDGLYSGPSRAGSIQQDARGFTLRLKAGALTSAQETQLREFIEQIFEAKLEKG